MRVKDAGTVLVIRHTSVRDEKAGRVPGGNGDRPALDRPFYDSSGYGAGYGAPPCVERLTTWR
ncbi:hypothetical protein GCM10010392_37580 [Streptomyces clavifer]|nr:hypothetical protein GCM10010392_37580 [Streptomyces clavifer]